MKIAMLSSEIAPFAKTGGLADVLGTLSPALEKRGHEISLIMPAYRSVLNGPFSLDETGMQLAVPLGASVIEASVLEARLGQNAPVYLVRADRYFDRYMSAIEAIEAYPALLGASNHLFITGVRP